MDRIVLSVKLFPEDPALDLNLLKEKIKGQLPNYASVYRFDEEPIAYGLVALIAHIVFPENKEGASDEIEEILGKVPGVSQIEVLMVRRA
jgi:elongation factor 1-beta